MLHRLKDRLDKGKKQQTGVKEGGHAKHWRCMYPDPKKDGLLALIEKTVNDRGNRIFSSDGAALYVGQEGGSGSICAWVEKNQVVSAYPEARNTHVWPIKLLDIIPWPNGIEGQIMGECLGAEISFFDTRFGVNSALYRIGETYEFSMGAFAYTAGPSQGWEAEIEGGTKVSFAGARAYMPAGGDADIDDYWFHSPLEGEISAIELNGAELRGYPITLALPNDFEMSVMMYAAPHAEEGDIQLLRSGGDIQGYLWLQGSLQSS